MIRFLFPAILLVGACHPIAPASKAARADYKACRERVNQVYNQQNRAYLSERDSRDEPFATNYNSGITSAGLGSRFGFDNMLAECTPGTQPIDEGAGTTFIGPRSH